MATFGKAIGNGYPIAAVVGKKDVMRAVESSFVSSSYWSEPASMAAAIAIQKILRRDKVIDRVWDLGKRYQDGIRKIARDFSLPLAVKGRPPVFFGRPRGAESGALPDAVHPGDGEAGSSRDERGLYHGRAYAGNH